MFSGGYGGHQEVAKAKPCRRTKEPSVSLRAAVELNFESALCSPERNALLVKSNASGFCYLKLSKQLIKTLLQKKIAYVLFR